MSKSENPVRWVRMSIDTFKAPAENSFVCEYEVKDNTMFGSVTVECSTMEQALDEVVEYLQSLKVKIRTFTGKVSD